MNRDMWRRLYAEVTPIRHERLWGLNYAMLASAFGIYIYNDAVLRIYM